MDKGRNGRIPGAWGRILASTLIALGISVGPADAQSESGFRRAVQEIAPQHLTVATPVGDGDVPLYVDRDWSRSQPDIVRAVLVLHGRLRNADVYKRSADAALAAAGPDARGTLMVVPQFLGSPDIEAHGLSPRMLRWGVSDWMGGEPARGPAPLSAFDILDAILAKLADRGLFPALRAVVVAGHSGGGQVVARYAVVGRGEAALTGHGIGVRYVIANPSSYLYFSPERPDADGRLQPFDGAQCPGFNDWKYGPANPVPYASGATITALEPVFARRDVIYLLGTADTDPNHSALDKSCEAETQGPTRYARGTAYVSYLSARHPGALAHRRWDVAGIGHNGDRMLTSTCGLAALFDVGTCTAAH